MKVTLTLTEEMLGTKAANPDVFKDYIASKCPDDDLRKQELDNAEHREEAGSTVFHRENGEHLGIYDYQIKGFFKDACGALRLADGKLSKSLTAYKTRIDGLIFVEPRFIVFKLPADAKAGVCERPIRVDTMQGPRVGLCRSETVPIGTQLSFTVTLLATKLGKAEAQVDVAELVREWFAYGGFRGLGQWRNSGKGRFTAEVKD